MAVLNKKRKAIVRSYPGKSVPELASELGLPKHEVKAVMKDPRDPSVSEVAR